MTHRRRQFRNPPRRIISTVLLKSEITKKLKTSHSVSKPVETQTYLFFFKTQFRNVFVPRSRNPSRSLLIYLLFYYIQTLFVSLLGLTCKNPGPQVVNTVTGSVQRNSTRLLGIKLFSITKNQCLVYGWRRSGLIFRLLPDYIQHVRILGADLTLR